MKFMVVEVELGDFSTNSRLSRFIIISSMLRPRIQLQNCS